MKDSRTIEQRLRACGVFNATAYKRAKEYAEERTEPLFTLLRSARVGLGFVPEEAVSNPLPPWGDEGLTNRQRLLDAIDAALEAEAKARQG